MMVAAAQQRTAPDAAAMENTRMFFHDIEILLARPVCPSTDRVALVDDRFEDTSIAIYTCGLAEFPFPALMLRGLYEHDKRWVVQYYEYSMDTMRLESFDGIVPAPYYSKLYHNYMYGDAFAYKQAVREVKNMHHTFCEWVHSVEKMGTAHDLSTAPSWRVRNRNELVPITVSRIFRIVQNSGP